MFREVNGVQFVYSQMYYQLELIEEVIGLEHN